MGLWKDDLATDLSRKKEKVGHWTLGKIITDIVWENKRIRWTSIE